MLASMMPGGVPVARERFMRPSMHLNETRAVGCCALWRLRVRKDSGLRNFTEWRRACSINQSIRSRIGRLRISALSALTWDGAGSVIMASRGPFGHYGLDVVSQLMVWHNGTSLRVVMRRRWRSRWLSRDRPDCDPRDHGTAPFRRGHRYVRLRWYDPGTCANIPWWCGPQSCPPE